MGAAMKAAIIGAGRKRNGIGEYIAKYFHDNRAEVTGVLGSTEKTASSAATNLMKYGIKAQSYTNFSTMIHDAQVECVAIASPSITHKTYIEQCIEAGVHIFCEKPFISPDVPDARAWTEDIFAKAQEKGLTIALNSQWPFSLPFYEELCGKLDPIGIKKFSIRLSPLSIGHEMIPDSVPHALSLLYFAAGSGKIDGLAFQGEDDSLLIRFTYFTEHTQCETLIELVRETAQPRTFFFGFNGRVVTRHIDLGTYTIHLTYEDKTLKITDPLGLSVRDFLAAVSSGAEPLLGRRHIIETASLLHQIYSGSMSR
jgi:hypothetical protein